jgi:hypothetical protein
MDLPSITTKNCYHPGGNSSWQVAEAFSPPGGNGRGLSTTQDGLWPTLLRDVLGKGKGVVAIEKISKGTR